MWKQMLLDSLLCCLFFSIYVNCFICLFIYFTSTLPCQRDWIELNSIYLFAFFSLICEQFVLTSMHGEVISRNHQTYS